MKRLSLFGASNRPVVRVLMWLLLVAGMARPLLAQEATAITRKVQPGDTLVISVDEPDIGKVEKKVDAEGKITFNLLGELNVKDKSTAEIEKIIRDGLDKDWIINPAVNVVVVIYAEQVVSVSGQVNRPGPVKLPPDRKLSLIEAVSQAGDVNPRGNRNKVQLSRKGVVTEYNLNKLAKITDPDQQIYVEADDIINVPQRKF